MNDQTLRLLARHPAPAALPRVPLGRYLVENEVISPDQLVQALRMQLRLGAPIGEILAAEGWADADDVQAALAQQHNMRRADLTLQPPDPGLCGDVPHEVWLRYRAIAWMRLGRTVLIATARPDRFAQLREALGDTFGDVQPVLASETQITDAIARQFAQPLAEAAETRVAPRFSCRTWQGGDRRRPGITLLAGAILAGLLTALFFAPLQSLGVLGLIATFTLLLLAGLKLAAFGVHLLSHAHLTAPRPAPDHTPERPSRLPKVSVLVPLFHEKEIAGALIRRLCRLSYPKALLEVVLVLEQDDRITRQALADARLPPWMRVVEVPAHGGLTTKPRAMNYALDFCGGDIIGVWDAEDAPAPDQIEQVVSHFTGAAEDVVCLQGILDYYNPRTNWLARCFTIEYASWFRIVLPGIARMGLVVPLGGTTLFFKREILEELGGWDAHNVTEDADLGVRLCRAGYRTELIGTVTYEEAACRFWPWIRQRSRWLKGFMVTYLVHMRRPRQLLRDLGGWRFWGLQAFFVGTLCQFLLAPVLWSFWLIVFGVFHPIQTLLPLSVVYAICALFVLAEVLTISIGMVAVSSARRRFLMPWTLTMIFYFPIGAIAAYKALGELLLRPYHWEKTQHGQADAEHPPGCPPV